MRKLLLQQLEAIQLHRPLRSLQWEPALGLLRLPPSVQYNSGTTWLSVTTNTTTISSGGNTTFTVTIISNRLPAGKYEATIRLSGSNNGMTVASNAQPIDVKLNVGVPSEPIMGTPTPTPLPTPVVTATPTPTPSSTPVLTSMSATTTTP